MQLDPNLQTILVGVVILFFPFAWLWIMNKGLDIEFGSQYSDFLREYLRGNPDAKNDNWLVSRLSALLMYLILFAFSFFSYIWTGLKLVVSPVFLIFAKLARVDFSIARRFDVLIGPIRIGNPKKSYERAISKFSDILRSGVRIQSATGEMGNKLMEHPKMIASIKEAKKENKAVIEILHGPRVDPKTKKIFKLAKEDTVKLRKSDYYFHNHFTLVRTKDKKDYLIVEQLHDEVLWNSRTKRPFHENKTRVIYIFEPKPKTLAKYQEVYTNRRKASEAETKSPGLRAPQEISLVKIVRELIWKNLVLSNAVQPFSIFWDIPVDLLFDESQ